MILSNEITPNYATILVTTMGTWSSARTIFMVCWCDFHRNCRTRNMYQISLWWIRVFMAFIYYSITEFYYRLPPFEWQQNLLSIRKLQAIFRMAYIVLLILTLLEHLYFVLFNLFIFSESTASAVRCYQIKTSTNCGLERFVQNPTLLICLEQCCFRIHSSS
jgi:hypothetical protein